MLRASSHSVGADVDAIAAIQGLDAGVPHGRALVTFVDAVTGSDRDAAAEARSTLAAEAGPTAVVEAAAVLANFEMMTRIADGTGAVQNPAHVERLSVEREALGLDRFDSAR